MTRAPKSSDLKETVSTRLTPPMRSALANLAAERRWTISAYIEWALEQHIAELAKKPPRRT